MALTYTTIKRKKYNDALQNRKKDKSISNSNFYNVFNLKDYFFLFLTLIIALTFSSCKKENTVVNEQNNLVGKWQLVETSDPGNYEPCDYKGWLNLLKTNKYEDYDACTKETGLGSWEFKNNAIVITADIFPVPISTKIISVSKSTLVLELSFFGNSRQTYKRLN